MSFPALLPEIGPECAGSATGIISTLELIGAVVIPTYIITPIAGQNFSLYFILAGSCMVIICYGENSMACRGDETIQKVVDKIT